jgi:hypothetical protein
LEVLRRQLLELQDDLEKEKLLEQVVGVERSSLDCPSRKRLGQTIKQLGKFFSLLAQASSFP